MWWWTQTVVNPDDGEPRWWWTQTMMNPDYDEPKRWWTQMVVAVITGKCWEEELLGLAIFGRSGKNRKAQEKSQICALSPWRGDRTFTKIKQQDQSGDKEELSLYYSARGLEALGRNTMDKYASLIHSLSTCYIPDSGRVLVNKRTWYMPSHTVQPNGRDGS